MERWRKRRVAVVVVAAVVACAAIAGLAFLPRGDDLRNIFIREVSERLGWKVTIASASWQLLPVLALTVRDVSTDHQQPITIRQLFLVPDVGRSLLQREISLDRIEVDGAVIPAVSLAALRGSPGVATRGAGHGQPGPPARRTRSLPRRDVGIPDRDPAADRRGDRLRPPLAARLCAGAPCRRSTRPSA